MRTPRILVVEDDHIIALDISQTVESFGYQITGVASNGTEAIQLAESQKPDLVLMDISLKGSIDGITVAEQIRARWPIPVIFLTAHADKETLSRVLDKGAFGHLTKPIRVEELQAAISIALRQHHALHELLDSNTWLTALLGSITEGVLAADQDGTVIYMNSQAGFITGWNLADAYGKPVEEVFRLSSQDGSALPETRVRTAATRQTGMPKERFVLHRRTGQEIVIEESIAPLWSGSQSLGAVSVFRDLSAAFQFEQAQKWKTTGILAAGVAHDFNNLLLVIIGNTLLAAETLLENSQEAVLLNRALAASESARKLVAQLLDYAGKSVSWRQSVDFGETIHSFANLLKAAIPENVELSIDAPNGLLRVDADPRQLQQIVTNLAINAAEAIGENPGSISISVVSANSGEGIFLAVRDTGPGMDAETRSKIFDPFFSTKFLGRGLGLAAVQGIVRSHEGTIDVDTTLGKGSTFTLFFPAGASRTEKARNGKSNSVVCANEYILVVDDSPDVSKFVKASLEQFAFKAVIAESGHDALNVLASGEFPIALVLLDLSMPVLSGSQTARLIRNKFPKMPICFMSGYNEEYAEAEISDRPLSQYFLQKPFTPDQLVAKIRVFLEQTQSRAKVPSR